MNTILNTIHKLILQDNDTFWKSLNNDTIRQILGGYINRKYFPEWFWLGTELSIVGAVLAGINLLIFGTLILCVIFIIIGALKSTSSEADPKSLNLAKKTTRNAFFGLIFLGGLLLVATALSQLVLGINIWLAPNAFRVCGDKTAFEYVRENDLSLADITLTCSGGSWSISKL